MVILKILINGNNGFNGNNLRKTADTFVESVETAICIGQASGLFYEIFDMTNGRTIDWTEVNFKEEEEWYYDEDELLWKKHAEEESVGELV